MSWYALDNPNDPQLDELASQFQLHPLHIEDCRSNNERLKAEGTDNYLFLILKYIQSVQDGDIGFASIYLFVGRDFLISVRDPTCVSNEILQRASKAGPEERPSKLLYLIIDSIVETLTLSLSTTATTASMTCKTAFSTIRRRRFWKASSTRSGS